MATYANGEAYEGGLEINDDDNKMITAEDCWDVIEAFFRDKGLVSQQLDSFDEFASTTLQKSSARQGQS
jgi:DNA-directed RNA polymerase II subunit RPB2